MHRPIQIAAALTALMSLPVFLCGCGGPSEQIVVERSPADTPRVQALELQKKAEKLEERGVLDIAAHYFAEAHALDPAVVSAAELAEKTLQIEQSSPEPLEALRQSDSHRVDGDPVAARKVLSQARAALEERGAELLLMPIEPGPVESLSWQGEQLAVLRGRSIPYSLGQEANGWRPSTWVELWDLDGSGDLFRSLQAATGNYAQHAEWTADGEALVVADNGEICVLDGTLTVKGECWGFGDAYLAALAVHGDSSSGLVAYTTGDGMVTVADLAGQVLHEYELTGETPSVTRVYTGEGSYHHNIPGTVDSWGTALAWSADGETLVVGGSDARARVLDLSGSEPREERVLSFPWDDQQRLSANANTNMAVALQLTGGGDPGTEDWTLHGVFQKGDVVTWRLADGELLGHQDGACTREEFDLVKPGYIAAGEEPDAFMLEDCGRTIVAAFSPDGNAVARSGVLIRGLDGALVAGIQTLTDRALAYGPDGLLLAGGVGGELMLTRPGTDDGWRALPSQGVSGQVRDLRQDGRLLITTEGGTVLSDIETGESMVESAGSVAELSAEGDMLVSMEADGFSYSEGDSLEVAVHQVADDGTTEARTLRIPVPGERLIAFELEESGQYLAMAAYESPEIVVVDLRTGTHRTWALSSGSVTWVAALSAELLATGSEDGVQLWDVASGQVLQSWDFDNAMWATTALSEDGERLAIAVFSGLLVVDTQTGGTLAHRPVPVVEDRSITPAALHFTADGQELLMGGGQGSLWRWTLPKRDGSDPAGQLQDVLTGDSMRSVERLEIREHVVLVWRLGGTIEIRTMDDLSLLATVLPLADGGWLARSPEGAVDGSAGAVSAVITLAQFSNGQILEMEGVLAWDRFHVPGLLERALAGERVEPVIAPMELMSPEERAPGVERGVVRNAAAVPPHAAVPAAVRPEVVGVVAMRPRVVVSRLGCASLVELSQVEFW